MRTVQMTKSSLIILGRFGWFRAINEIRWFEGIFNFKKWVRLKNTFPLIF